MTSKFILPVMATFIAAAAFAVTDSKPAAKTDEKLTALFEDKPVAKGKGFEIKRSQLDASIVSVKASIAARGQQIPAEQVRMLERQVLDGLIQVQLLTTKATDADKAKGKETAEKRYAALLKRAGSEEIFNRQLKSVGMDSDSLHAKMIEESTAEAVVDRELKVAATDDDAKKFYEDHPSQFEQPEMVRASHILIGTVDPDTREQVAPEKKAAKRKQIDDLLKRARGGEDFAKLAKEFSEDPGSKDDGGEYTFPRGKMVAEFESAAFSLKTNDISDVVTTQFGYHIIRLSEKIPAKKVEYDKVAADLKEMLKGRQMQKLLPDYFEKLRADAGIEILDEKLKAKDALDIEPAMPEEKPATAEKSEKSGDKK